ncbi:MAG TPA: hypothetical protein VGU68_06045 [Ktedonobacteraceae bacterium]|nr:hypothetical protein [Ktedonobacteraceae bacterium]
MMARQRYSVFVYAKTDPVFVTANYFVIVEGALCFRNNATRGGNGYPETVRVFAAGAWSDVEAWNEPPQTETS